MDSRAFPQKVRLQGFDSHCSSRHETSATGTILRSPTHISRKPKPSFSLVPLIAQDLFEVSLNLQETSSDPGAWDRFPKGRMDPSAGFPGSKCPFGMAFKRFRVVGKCHTRTRQERDSRSGTSSRSFPPDPAPMGVPPVPKLINKDFQSSNKMSYVACADESSDLHVLRKTRRNRRHASPFIVRNAEISDCLDPSPASVPHRFVHHHGHSQE